MNFFQRYVNGEMKAVYNDIQELGQSAFLPENLFEIENVLDETFRRTAFNLKIIYRELGKIGYCFKTEFRYNFERPLIEPLPETAELLEKLRKTVCPFGYIPLSLEKFYTIVGACNFVWDYDVSSDLFWSYADPIQICSLDDLVSFASDTYWAEEMQDATDQTQPYTSEFPYLEVAADYFHKDNVSGGAAYAIQITEAPSIDSLFLNEPHNTTFVDYLRICFENCGFSGIEGEYPDDRFRSFAEIVRPQLKPI